MEFNAIRYQFDTKQLAEELLEELQKICDDSGFVTLAVLERAVGLEPSDYAYLHGWEDLDASTVCPIGLKFYIRVPRPTPVNYFYVGGDTNE